MKKFPKIIFGIHYNTMNFISSYSPYIVLGVIVLLFLILLAFDWSAVPYGLSWLLVAIGVISIPHAAWQTEELARCLLYRKENWDKEEGWKWILKMAITALCGMMIINATWNGFWALANERDFFDYSETSLLIIFLIIAAEASLCAYQYQAERRSWNKIKTPN